MNKQARRHTANLPLVQALQSENEGIGITTGANVMLMA